MRFSLFDLLLLTFPAAIFCLWIAHCQRQDRIEWQNFSMVDMAERQKHKTPFLILCVPDMFWNSQPPLSGEIDPELPNDIDMNQLVAYRYEYRYWTQSPSDWPAETKWIVDHGAGKEPSLILVSSDGKTKNLRGFRFGRDEIIGFLQLDRSKFGRDKVLFGLFASSLLVTIAAVVRKHKRTRYAG